MSVRKLITALGIIAITTGVSPALGDIRLGAVGATYRIAEPDALSEIKAAAAKADWRAVFRDARAWIKQYRPKDLKSLPPATKHRSFLVDMTYTLDRDIPDGKGGILYPKGYTFNPLDYVRLTRILVILDGGDRRQVDWFKTSQYADDYRVTTILTGGDYYDLMKELDRPVFYLPAEMADRLHLTAVPSVVRQRGKHLEVTEIPAAKEKDEP